jgi:imidazolonepropionase-like amidohydrolase
MRTRTRIRLLVALSVATLAQSSAQQPTRTVEHTTPPHLAPAVAKYVKYDTAKNTLWLEHVRVIDGTGAAPVEDATVILSAGKIAAVITPRHMEANEGHMPAWSCTACPPALHIDLTGHTIFPGLVGMHDHMYYIARPNYDERGHFDPPLMVPEMAFSSPRLYLGAGVTPLRTTGSVEPYLDLNLRTEIDAGQLPGPYLDVTAPYLEGPNSPFIQMHQLKDAAEARGTVEFWISQGATSFKAYMNITRAELKAAIDEAHKHGLKLTGHLCSVTYPRSRRPRHR